MRAHVLPAAGHPADVAIAGWRVRCDRPCEWAPRWSADPDRAVDISVRHAPLAASEQEPLLSTPLIRCFPGLRTEVRFSAALSFLIEAGERITVDAGRGVDPASVDGLLLGPVWPLLALQRGQLLMRAACAVRAGRALLIIGRSGSGKSTLLLHLLQRGYELVGDDWVRLDAAKARVFPSYSGLRLWRDALEHSGVAVDACERIRPDAERFHLHRDCVAGPVALQRVLVLEQQRGLRLPRLQSLAAPQAMVALSEWVCAAGLIGVHGLQTARLEQAARLARLGPVSRLVRPASIEPQRLLDLIEESDR